MESIHSVTIQVAQAPSGGPRGAEGREWEGPDSWERGELEQPNRWKKGTSQDTLTEKQDSAQGLACSLRG